MNTATGEVRRLEMLSEPERASGEWVPVSETVARHVQIGQRVDSRRRARKAARAARKRNRTK